MKLFFNLYLLFVVGLLPTTNLLSQTLSRYTTAELLNKAKKNGPDFINSYPEVQLNYALPLIDSAVAVELARLAGLSNGGMFFSQYPGYAYAISLQCEDDSLKQMLITALLEYDKSCNDFVMTKNQYDQLANGKLAYEYSNILKNAMLKQIQKNDTNLLKIVTKEYEFWAPLASGYFDTIAKPGWHQLSIGKRKFKPCMLASPVNAGLWASCIHLLTGNEDYGSSNEQLDNVYKRFMKIGSVKRDPEERKGFVRLGKTEVIPLTASCNTLDSLDFETIPELKEKFDRCRKSKEWRIILYTHENKALLFLSKVEKTMSGFRQVWDDFSSVYLAELNTPSTLQLSKITYRERYE